MTLKELKVQIEAMEKSFGADDNTEVMMVINAGKYFFVEPVQNFQIGQTDRKKFTSVTMPNKRTPPLRQLWRGSWSAPQGIRERDRVLA